MLPPSQITLWHFVRQEKNKIVTIPLSSFLIHHLIQMSTSTLSYLRAQTNGGFKANWMVQFYLPQYCASNCYTATTILLLPVGKGGSVTVFHHFIYYIFHLIHFLKSMLSSFPFYFYVWCFLKVNRRAAIMLRYLQMRFFFKLFNVCSAFCESSRKAKFRFHVNNEEGKFQWDLASIKNLRYSRKIKIKVSTFILTTLLCIVQG